MGERPLILDIIDQWEQEIDEIVESDIPELALDEKISELEEIKINDFDYDLN